MNFLFNRIDKKVLKQSILKSNQSMKTISFYRYHPMREIKALRDELYLKLSALGTLGRIYLAEEGINAQISIPEHRFFAFKNVINGFTFGKGINFRFALEEKKFSFYKLKIKIRKKIVADGLEEPLELSSVGKAISAEVFNEYAEHKNTLIIDVRNHYETEVGHMKNALKVDSDTFRELLPELLASLKKIKNSQQRKLILYCTGGIRCEKASAFLIQKGFSDVNQLSGGIIGYTEQVKKKKLANNFIGKNFVFDDRLGERVTEDVIAFCHQCREPCDEHTNCANDDCHLLFIQCIRCKEKMDNCCCEKCRKIIKLPVEEQRKIRRGKKEKKSDNLAVYRSRLRPPLSLHLSSDSSKTLY